MLDTFEKAFLVITEETEISRSEKCRSMLFDGAVKKLNEPKPIVIILNTDNSIC